MEARLAAFLVRRRGWLVAVSLVVLALLASGVRHVWFDTDYRLFFAADNPQLLAHEQLQTEFTRTEGVSFVLAPADGRVFTPRTLMAIEDLTAAAWQIPYAVRVDSVTNYQYSRAEGDELRVSNLIDNAGAMDLAEIAVREQVALAEPVLAGGLLARQGDVTAVSVRLVLPERRPGEPDMATPAVMEKVQAMARAFREAHPDIAVRLMGVVPVNAAFNDLAQRDAMTLVPAMFAVVAVLLLLFLRSLSATLVTVTVIFASLIVAVGFMGWIGYAANQVNVSAPTLILTLAVSDCVHLLLTYLAGVGRGLSRPAAMEESLRLNLWAVFFTSLTTAIGFLGLNFSDSPPFVELGNLAAFGVMATMVLSFTLLPGLAIALPVRMRPGMAERGHWPVIDHIGEFALRRRRPLLMGLPVVVLFCAVFIPRNDLNDDTVGYFAPGTAVREAFDFVDRELTGIDSIAYELRSSAPAGVADPAFLRKVESFAQWWRAQPETAHVTSFTDVMKRLNRNMHGDDPAYERIPDDAALAAQYLLLYELSLPLGLDLNDMVNFDKTALRLSVGIHALKSRQLIELEARAQRWLAEHAPGMASPGSSVSVMFAHIGQRNIESMVRGSLVAALLISLTMMLSLRSLKFGLLSVIPNLLPAAMAFGIWGLLVGEVNLAVAAVFSVASGIIIDDTTHFLGKYLRARRREGRSQADAVRYAFATTGSALFVNTVVLVAGFLVLTLSDFTVNAWLGFMTALVIAIALVFDFLFLPGLLLRFDRKLPPPAAARKG